MKYIGKITIALFLIVALVSCSKNYYSGTNKGGKGCGCPSVRR
jgi:hypothetical protein